jgi:competence ComEA-like helix-hairpin-helix protein
MASTEKTKPTEWTRTPAAAFSAAVLGLASIGGVGYSIMVHEPATAVAMDTDQPADAGFPSPARVVYLVDLNSATLAELQLLPGIGPVTAKSIIDDRTTNGPYEQLEDLDRVRGIGPRTIESIRDRVEIARTPADG